MTSDHQRPERRTEPRDTPPPPDWGQILGQALDGEFPDAPALERLLDERSRQRG
ncbi:hypothetical protein [Rhodosalinus sp.]|uniref:hypothetical protein n=1 Tax=Rhodosalinus sp. TaxID=2047741 RepID=UPI003567F0D1